MNEHDESAPRARSTRKSRALKRPSRWLEKRTGAVSSRRGSEEPVSTAPASIDPASTDPASTAPLTIEPVTIEPAAEPAETSFDDHAVDFFRKGDTEPVPAPLEVDDGDDVDTARARSVRRRSFSRHVMVVVALSAVLCIAGFVRSGTSASAAQRGTNAVTLTPFVVASAATPLPSAPAIESAPPAPATEVAPAAPAEVAPPAPAPAASADAPAQVSPVEARAAREDARRALDRGAVAAAIAAGTSSVELDPTDADAWLILGAAYQVAGKSAEARDAFASCRKLAKRGDVSECRAF